MGSRQVMAGSVKPSWPERIAAVAAVLGIVVAIISGALAQWNQVNSGRDTTKAIREMAAIAAATRAERPAMERQADAAADAAAAAKTTAQLAKGQTVAIVRQADALIGSANATVTATGAQVAAAHAQSEAAIAVAATSIPTARFGGVRMPEIKNEPGKDGLVVFTFEPIFINSGTVAIIPATSEIHLLFAKELPIKPVVRNNIHFGGNDLSVNPGSTFSIQNGTKLTIQKSQRDELFAGKLAAFVWGDLLFTGARGGQTYHRCFVAQIVPALADWTNLATYSLSAPSYCVEAIQH